MPGLPPTFAAGSAPSQGLCEPAALTLATQAEAQQAVRHAREVFGRTLACWAGDMLALRARGLHVTTWTDGSSWRRLKRAA